MIRWQINHGKDYAPEVYGASRFRDHFYRPDVVERVLQTLDEGQAVVLADREAGRQNVTRSIENETPPRVAIIDPENGTFVKEATYGVAYQIEDRPGATIRRLRLKLDNSVAAEATELTVPVTGRLNGELRVALQGGAPALVLQAENEHGWSEPAVVRLRRPSGADQPKPDLYVLATGIDTFKQHPQLGLHYAAADARDFSTRMRRQEGGLYTQV